MQLPLVRSRLRLMQLEFYAMLSSVVRVPEMGHSVGQTLCVLCRTVWGTGGSYRDDPPSPMPPNTAEASADPC